MLMAFRW